MPHQAVDDELLDDRVVGVDGVAAAREVEQLDVLAGVDLVVRDVVDAPGVVGFEGGEEGGGEGAGGCSTLQRVAARLCHLGCLDGDVVDAPGAVGFGGRSEGVQLDGECAA